MAAREQAAPAWRGVTAVIHEYGFAHIPQDARRGRAWIASLAPLFEARLGEGAIVPVGAFHRYHRLDDAVFAAFDGPAQTIERPGRLVSKQGLDHLVLRTHASGRAWITTGGRVAEAGPGDLVVLDLARPVLIEAEAAAGVAIVLPRRILDETGADTSLGHGLVLTARMAPLARLVAVHLQQLADCLPMPLPVARHLVPATLALCRSLVIEREGDGIPASDVAVGIAIRRYVEDHLATVDVPTLTSRFGLSRATLYRRFAGQGGLVAHIRDRRLAAAMRRLARPPDGRRPMLARLAHECGFADPRVFSRAFHRRYGLWPGEMASTRLGPDAPATEAPPMAWLREL